MNSKIPSFPYRSFLLALAALAGCSTGNLALNMDESRPLPLSRRPAEGGNGGPRGGGDRVAGEFMECERVALAKMEAWKKQGKIAVTDEELAKIRSIMPPNEPKNPKHVVTSQDHVCIVDKKNEKGECTNAGDERDVVKEPFGHPPTIYVGRVRWDEPANTAAKKELICQHELRGLALSKPGETFADEAFSASYAALNEVSKEWNALVRTHLDYLRKIRMLDEMSELVDLTHFDTVTKTFTSSSADYNRCVNASDAEVNEINKIEGKLAKKANKKRRSGDLFGNLRQIEQAEKDLNDTDVKQACDRALDQYQNLLLKYGTPQIQDQANQIRAKVVAVTEEWQKWANAVTNPGWHNWLFTSMQKYIDRRNWAFAKFNSRPVSASDIAATLNPILDEKCPRARMKDFREAVKCNVDAGVPVANAYFRSVLGKVVDDLVAAHDESVDEIASQVDPL